MERVGEERQAGWSVQLNEMLHQFTLSIITVCSVLSSVCVLFIVVVDRIFYQV